MTIKRLVYLLVLTSLLPTVYGSCAPNTMSDGLQRCLQYQSLNTHWQFPFVPPASYSSLCSNSTCLSYCFTLVTIPCAAQHYTDHLRTGDAIKAAYLGFCDRNKADVEDALTCANNVLNQDALNEVSAFQTTIQGYFSTSYINGTAVCLQFTSLVDNLRTLMMARCSGDPQTVWTTFFYTLVTPCDSTRTPSVYANYSETIVSQCADANSLIPDSYLFVTCCIMVALTFVAVF